MEEPLNWQMQIWKCPTCGFQTSRLSEKNLHVQKTKNDFYHKQRVEEILEERLELLNWLV